MNLPEGDRMTAWYVFDDSEPVEGWMVYAAFGPFESKEEAQEFASRSPYFHVSTLDRSML